ncbi:aromatic amino acid ammonia-lyase [Micromonospora sp. WMMD1128]|uniref:aromatic amino acid ammonia-lyase n=1 Tax=Micromonospora sp. WMMD1128 TaxID=3015150 RepID=UPI00248BF477|nr:aromatic amino acid ammonia-lyase [Micromonospora sp. WMMD1128]WBB77011.1 aromatic amino acid ammonia-lyase [Micromonospora sp. WMMD1128]
MIAHSSTSAALEGDHGAPMPAGDGTAYLAAITGAADWDATLPPCDDADVARMESSAATIDKHLAAGEPIYGLTQGFGPLVLYAAESEMEQGTSLISHLGTGQGQPLAPEVSRLVLWLRLASMRKGFSAVSPEFWQRIADLWNAGFTPCIPRDGTVSASGDLQPLAHAALACTGHGEAWVRERGDWVVRPAAEALAAIGAEPVRWPVREALAFVNGTGVGLALSILNHRSALQLVRAVAALSARLATLLGANPEHYDDGVGFARGQAGQITVARWITGAMPADARRDPSRPLQEPYSLRCAPQVLGAVLDQVSGAADLLAREARGCTDNPITVQGRVLHAGNFHAMPVGFASDQLGLAVHMAAYLAERQLGLIVNPVTNGDLPPMLTPRAGRGCGLAGVQISATSFISRIRQLVYPASLTTLPTNGWNQDHVPMALNGANGVSEALDLAWLTVGSLALGVAQLTAMTQPGPDVDGVWAELARVSPPLAEDRPMGPEVRAARDLMRRHAAQLLVDRPEGAR